MSFTDLTEGAEGVFLVISTTCVICENRIDVCIGKGSNLETKAVTREQEGGREMEPLKLNQLKSEDVLMLDPGALASSGVRPPEAVMGVLRLCDGMRSIRQVVGDCHYHPETTLRVVFKAMDLGFIRKACEPAPAMMELARRAANSDMDVGVEVCTSRASYDVLSNSVEFYQKLVDSGVTDSEPMEPTVEKPRRAVSQELALVDADEDEGADEGAYEEARADTAAGFEAIDEEFFGSYVPEEHLTREDLVAMGAIKMPRNPSKQAAGRNGTGRNGTALNSSGRNGTPRNGYRRKVSRTSGRARQAKGKGWMTRMSGWIAGFLSF